MPRILLFVAPAVGRWLWKKYRTGAPARRSGLPAAASRPDLSQPQRQVEAMEQAVDVPGGIRP
jgi:hypothetical protein